MKKALIDPSVSVSYVVGWNMDVDPPQPIFQQLPNSQRVAEVLDTPFEVAPPLHWVDCADEVVADVWYFNAATSTIDLIPEPPAQTGVVGAQTL